MIQFFKDVRNFVRNLIYWFPILWDDGDYDYNYLLRHMIHKLNAMGKHIREHDFIMEAGKVADEIDSVSVDLQMVETRGFENAAFETHSAKWGETVWELIDREDGRRHMRIHYPNAPTPELDSQANEELRALLDDAEANNQALLESALARMAKQMFGWWD